MDAEFGFDVEPSPYPDCLGLDLSYLFWFDWIHKWYDILFYSMHHMVKEAQRYFPTALQKNVRLVYIVLVVEVVVG